MRVLEGLPQLEYFKQLATEVCTVLFVDLDIIYLVFCGWSNLAETLLRLLKGVERSHQQVTLGKKNTIHQLTTMLSTSKNVLFPDHNHLLTTGADDPTLNDHPSVRESDD